MTSKISHRPCRYLILFCFLWSFRASSVMGIEYGNLPIHAFGIDNSTMTLYLEGEEAEILVSSLIGEKIDERTLDVIIPYPDSEYAALIRRGLQERQDLTLGHALPYYYIAVNHVLSRIFKNGLLVPRDEDVLLAQRFGVMIDSHSPVLNNLRDLITVNPIRDVHLRVEIYSDIKAFEDALSDLQLHSAGAFWDHTTNRLGVFIKPPDHFAALRSLRAEWGDLSLDELVRHLRDYIGKITLDALGHELVHFVQKYAQSGAYRVPFLAEAGATFVADNIAFREELVRLGDTLAERGIPPTLAPEPMCRLLIDGAPRLGHSGLIRLVRGLSMASKNSFNLESVLMMDDEAFYGSTGEQLGMFYDLSGAFVLFAWDLPRPEFLAHFGPLLDRHGIVSASDLDGVNEKFHAWMNRVAANWWLAEDADGMYDRATKLVTNCLNSDDYVSAHSGTRLMYALRPTSTTSLLYAGDVFWELDIPFFAFDYYALARKEQRKAGSGPASDPRVFSRLGDAYEQFGDIKSAVEAYSGVELTDGLEELQDAGILITTLRSKLKHSFYDYMLSRGLKQSQTMLWLMDTYVRELQSGQCLIEKDRSQLRGAYAALETNPFVFISLFTQHFADVERRMMAEIERYEIEPLLRSRTQRCQ